MASLVACDLCNECIKISVFDSQYAKCSKPSKT